MRPEKRLTALVFLLVGLLFVQLIGGCASASPSRVLVDANESYAALLNSFADLKAAGLLTDADKARVAPYVAIASKALDEMQAAYNGGLIDKFNAAVALFKQTIAWLGLEKSTVQSKVKQKGSVSYGRIGNRGRYADGFAGGHVPWRVAQEANL